MLEKHNKPETGLSRRGFLKGLAGITAGLSAPMFIPASALGRAGVPAPSERITLAGIGVGGMGQIDTANFLGVPECQVVAACDVDRNHLTTCKELVDNYYSNRESETYKGCDTYDDFRELLQRKDIDAVYCATPDHWHELVEISALRAGKDVYGEKPMTLKIAEGRRLVNEVNRTGRVYQLGTQSRSHAGVCHVVELVRNGRIGRIKRVEIGIPKGIQAAEIPVQPVPDHLNYDMWLGPAPWRPYIPEQTHFHFRWVRDFSDGPITDLGTHYLDITKWACKHDYTGPQDIEGWAEFPTHGIFNAAINCGFKLTYADGIIYDVSTEYPLGPKFIGTEGWIRIPMSHPIPMTPITASDPRILKSVIKPSEERIFHSENHWATFVHAVKTRGETAVPAEVGHRSTTLPHLGTIAMVTRRKLRWDPVAERFLNDDDANALLDRSRRAEWANIAT